MISRPALACLLAAAFAGSSCGSSPAAPSVTSVAGMWDGPASNHLGGHTLSMTLTQSGTVITGAAATRGIEPVGTTCASCHMNKTGTVTGTITGSALTLTMVFPAGNPADPTPICSATITLTGVNVAGTSIEGAYGGSDTCEGTFNGSMAMTRK